MIGTIDHEALSSVLVYWLEQAEPTGRTEDWASTAAWHAVKSINDDIYDGSYFGYGFDLGVQLAALVMAHPFAVDKRAMKAAIHQIRTYVDDLRVSEQEESKKRAS